MLEEKTMNQSGYGIRKYKLSRGNVTKEMFRYLCNDGEFSEYSQEIPVYTMSFEEYLNLITRKTMRDVSLGRIPRLFENMSDEDVKTAILIMFHEIPFSVVSTESETGIILVSGVGAFLDLIPLEERIHTGNPSKILLCRDSCTLLDSPDAEICDEVFEKAQAKLVEFAAVREIVKSLFEMAVDAIPTAKWVEDVTEILAGVPGRSEEEKS